MDRFTQTRRARWILAVAAFASVLLFCVNANARVRSRGAVKTDEHSRNGAGVIIWSDGVGYYAWLRSALIDHDWRFENEFSEFNPWRVEDYRPTERTPAGYRPNQWAVGEACVWALPVIVCHAFVSAGMIGSWPADGYSLPYQLTVGCTTLVLGLLTLLFMYRICRHFVDAASAASATTLMTLATPLVYYAAIEPSMAHAPAAACLAVFVWYWLRGFGDVASRRWFLLGFFLGVAALMRWQLATYAVLPAGEWLWLLFRNRSARPTIARSTVLVLLSLAGGTTGVFPQLIAWKVVYGSWLVEPLPLSHAWFSPKFWDVLGDTDRALFYWTPITLFATVGLMAAAFRQASQQRVQMALMLVGFTIQVYALAAIRGHGVYLGSAYGYRFLTESCVVLAPGLAFLLAAARRPFVVIGLLLVGWNLLLVGAYRFWLLPPDAGASPLELWNAALRYGTKHGTEAVLIVFAPVVVLALLTWPRRALGRFYLMNGLRAFLARNPLVTGLTGRLQNTS